MNKDRRKHIAEIVANLETVKETLSGLASDIETIREEEQEYFDNMPESFQMGEKGQAAEAAIDALDSAHSDLEDIDFEDITQYLETAQE